MRAYGYDKSDISDLSVECVVLAARELLERTAASVAAPTRGGESGV
jgi:hypothetical protein